MMHIGLCADENFALPFGVCLTSIFENNSNESLTVHVITQGFSNKTLERIKLTESKYGQDGSVKIYNINDDDFSEYPLSVQFPKSIYFRYLFADLLPDTIERIIYIDCDTVILSNLRNLWETPMDDHILLGAVEDRNGDDILIHNRLQQWNREYYNSGVLLMNLRLWRSTNAFKTFTTFLKEHSEICLYPDQDAINVVFRDKFMRLPFQFNYSMSFVAPFETFRLHLAKKNEIETAFNQLVILHYAAEIKPWFKDSHHPLLFLWRYYHNISEWKSVKLKYRQSLIRRILKKIMIRLLYSDTKDLINANLHNQLENYKKEFRL